MSSSDMYDFGIGSIAHGSRSLVDIAGAAERECEIPGGMRLRWDPHAFPQGMFSVCDSGWSCLKSPHAVARITDFAENGIERRALHLTRPVAAHHGEPVVS